MVRGKRVGRGSVASRQGTGGGRDGKAARASGQPAPARLRPWSQAVRSSWPSSKPRRSIPRLSTAPVAPHRCWTGAPVLDRPAGPGPVRRNGKHGPAESRTLRDPPRLERDPPAGQRGTRYVPRKSLTVDDPSSSPGVADAGTTARRGGHLRWMRAAGTWGGVAAPRTRGYASQPAGEGRAGHRDAPLP
jgi:hypothetical protein